MMSAAEIVFPENNMLLSISASQEIPEERRREDFGTTGRFGLVTETPFSVVMDESTDVTGIALLTIFICAVVKSFISWTSDKDVTMSLRAKKEKTRKKLCAVQLVTH